MLCRNWIAILKCLLAVYNLKLSLYICNSWQWKLFSLFFIVILTKWKSDMTTSDMTDILYSIYEPFKSFSYFSDWTMILYWFRGAKGHLCICIYMILSIKKCSYLLIRNITRTVSNMHAMNGNIPVAVRCMFQLPVIFQFPGTRKFKYHKSKFPITFYVMRAIFIYGPLSLTQVNFNPSMDK